MQGAFDRWTAVRPSRTPGPPIPGVPTIYLNGSRNRRPKIGAPVVSGWPNFVLETSPAISRFQAELVAFGVLLAVQFLVSSAVVGGRIRVDRGQREFRSAQTLLLTTARGAFWIA